MPNLRWRNSGRGFSGRKIISLSRRGKHLIFELDNSTFLIVHMRMTGSLLLKKADEEPGTSVRVIIYLDDGTAIHFRDMRRFGKMWLVKDKNSVIGKLGPEPLEPEFTPEVLAKILKDRKLRHQRPAAGPDSDCRDRQHVC